MTSKVSRNVWSLTMLLFREHMKLLLNVQIVVMD